MKKYQRREENRKRNTALIESSGFDLHYFSDIHVRIDDRIDFWLSTGTWHIKNQKSESKCYNEMIKYLKGEVITGCKPYCNELILIDYILTGGVIGAYKCKRCGKKFK